jgi:hypothetical protein
MKHSLVFVSLLAACGGRDTQQTTPTAMPMPEAEPPPVEEPIAEAPEPAPPPVEEEELPPVAPPPRMMAAQAELRPVRGQKLQPVVIRFQQAEGQTARVVAESSFEGLRPGKYHLLVHESAECGANAAKIGPVWERTASAPIALEATKDTPATIEEGDVAFELEGDAAITDRTLVLHADQRGKPGRVIACGEIRQVDVEQPETTGALDPSSGEPSDAGGGTR